MAALDIVDNWGRLNDTIVSLVDVVPGDKLDWSPREGLWNFRGILIHTAMTRDGWMGGFVGDGGPSMDAPGAIGDFIRRAQTKSEIQHELRRTWDRVAAFLADPAKLAATYRWDNRDEPNENTGHWVAFHLLEHDVHHRADIFHYLALLGVEHPEIGTP